ncbi:MAG: hypothetical protein IJJ50_08790 [Lachnospiraceae bacterium]|nr:hypothetical protein [Lachnospiraceae bacterium]
MLTVIIYKKSSQYFIDRYRSLFQPYLSAKKIAFCFWDENGTDIASSLATLADTVRGVPRWKAIVALPLTSDMEEAAVQWRYQENPFDYTGKYDEIPQPGEEPKVMESEVPLIRLAHMLGGVPLPDQNLPPEEYEAQQEEWERLEARYSFGCDRPSFLYLFAARIQREISLPDTTDREIMERHESDSSMFWYRNRYPAKARFMVQDCSRPGHAHFREDVFGFWMTVLTVALNDMPTGTFEAYKLYKVKAEVDKKTLHETFSDYYNRLSGVQFSAEKRIIELRKNTHHTREMDELPPYEMQIDVPFSMENEEAAKISSKDIGFAGDCPVKEEEWWRGTVYESRSALRKLFRSLQVVLDRSSISSRFNAKLLETEIHEMDEYQVQELEGELQELEKDILVFNTGKALPIRQFNSDLEEADKAAVTSMRKRMSRSLTVWAGIIILLIYLAGYIPDIIWQIRNDTLDGDFAALIFIGADLLTIALVLGLFSFRSVIRAKIHDYNGVVTRIMGHIRQAGKVFSDYLSKCCSYMRGQGMLQALLERTMVSTMSIKMLSLHKEKLGDQMRVIEDWLGDADLHVLPDRGEAGYADFNFEIEPRNNREYLIHLDFFDLSIEMDDGSAILAPYPFVDALHVRRESLYEKPLDDEEDEEEGEEA